uniref:Gamma-interferon-inducible lysosomal thiol reductase-like n=1 Tax=Rhizophora mucronata TaxID=61149 RepID=A0A2P2IWE6_RHIMU
MASRRPTITPSSLVYLFFFFIFFFLSSFTSASRPVRRGSDKVRLDLYYESLCPYSAGFIVNYLAELFEDDGDLLSIVDLHLYPWGNAMIRGNDTFVCQHGPAECLLNTVEACAIDAWPKLVRTFHRLILLAF